MKGMLSALLLLVMCLCRAPMFLGDNIYCYNTSNCYRIHLKEQKFADAQASCGPKGSLATMRNQQEMSEIMQLLSPLQSETDFKLFWIGLTKKQGVCMVDLNKLGGFVWISGEENSTLALWENKPKKSCTSKRCVILKVRNNTAVWKDSPCGKLYASICRSKAPWNSFMSELTDSIQIIHPFTDKFKPTEFPEMSEVIMQCMGCDGNISLTCKAENSLFLCTKPQCFCAEVNSNERSLELEEVKINNTVSCLEQCLVYIHTSLPPITSSTKVYTQGSITKEVACPCSDVHGLCPVECDFNISVSSTKGTYMTTKLPSLTNTTSVSGDEGLFDTLIIPLILGLVALGILAMLLWGGIQMCLRRKKPQRKKSIVPTETKDSDTDSTDHSSSDEEDTQDKTDLP